MYALRGIAVSLSVFFLLYSGLSAMVGLASRNLSRKLPARSSGRSSQRWSNLLFAVRLSPAVVAIVITLTLAVPSFVMLEPRSAEEPLSVLAMALAGGGIAVLLAGLWNAAFALRNASEAVGRWSAGARATEPDAAKSPVSVLRTTATAPPLTAAGILKPTVWLSGAAEFVLNERELQSALRHEFVHVRRRDNLRKLILRFVAFPGMNRIEADWREATEMAADDSAVSTAAEALDLAAAVIKLSQLTPFNSPVELTTSLVQSPVESVNARVQRLIEWNDPRSVASENNSWRYAVCAVASVAVLAATYGDLLLRIHEATEWLVR